MGFPFTLVVRVVSNTAVDDDVAMDAVAAVVVGNALPVVVVVVVVVVDVVVVDVGDVLDGEVNVDDVVVVKALHRRCTLTQLRWDTYGSSSSLWSSNSPLSRYQI